jgi:hypothetical protein
VEGDAGKQSRAALNKRNKDEMHLNVNERKKKGIKDVRMSPLEAPPPHLPTYAA